MFDTEKRINPLSNSHHNYSRHKLSAQTQTLWEFSLPPSPQGPQNTAALLLLGYYKGRDCMCRFCFWSNIVSFWSVLTSLASLTRLKAVGGCLWIQWVLFIYVSYICHVCWSRFPLRNTDTLKRLPDIAFLCCMTECWINIDCGWEL